MKICEQDRQKVIIPSSGLEAGIFDLDGVITQTARVHASAWKEMFDEYLRSRSSGPGEMMPFEIDSDYRRYVDGKPRYEGVKSFLESRNIHLPYGSPDDPEDKETVCGLGNRKNGLFRRKIREQGVETFAAAADFIRRLREKEIKTAVVSSSKNCADILEAAGLTGLFDARVDGNDLDEYGLKGKPDPDIFLEAARRLNVDPEASVVFEDAISGVQAGKSGGFGFVFGVARRKNSLSLKKAGADAVIENFSQIVLDNNRGKKNAGRTDIPSALENIRKIEQRLKDKRLALFLDYDGTLTPIVRRPEMAVLSEEMRETVKRLGEKIFVAVVSGRDLSDVRKMVGIPSLCYAGSHGFDISGPEGEHLEFQKGKEYIPRLDKAEKKIRSSLEGIAGARIENKKFSFAVHFREVSPGDQPRIEKAVDEAVAQFSGLRKSPGKKVFEVQPDLDWNKGKALLWLLESFHLNVPDALPLYIGDDVTDEDAFRVLEDRGIGILVAEKGRASAARYRLNDPGEVRLFLRRLGSIAKGER